MGLGKKRVAGLQKGTYWFWLGVFPFPCHEALLSQWFLWQTVSRKPTVITAPRICCQEEKNGSETQKFPVHLGKFQYSAKCTYSLRVLVSDVLPSQFLDDFTPNLWSMGNGCPQPCFEQKPNESKTQIQVFVSNMQNRQWQTLTYDRRSHFTYLRMMYLSTPVFGQPAVFCLKDYFSVSFPFLVTLLTRD